MATKYEMTLVWSEENDHGGFAEREIAAYNPYEKIVIKTKNSIFVGKERVVKTHSQKITGRNHKTGTRYYRWVTMEATTFYRDRLGRVTGRRMHAPGKYSTVTFSDLRLPIERTNWNAENYDRIALFNKILEDVFGEPVNYHTVYPLASHWNLEPQGDWIVPPGIRPALKGSNLKEFCEHVFGKTRTRRDLMRAVGNAQHLNCIFVASQFKGFVPVDWMVKFINDNDAKEGWGHQNFGVFRPLLYRMDPKSYRSLLFDPDPNIGEIRDLTHLCSSPFNQHYLDAAAGRWRSWHEFHDGLFPRNNRMRAIYAQRTMEPMEIPETPISQQLSGLAVGGFKVVTPAMTTDLVNWGSQMGNCIGSYAGRVVQKHRDTELGGIYQGDKLVANFEIHRGRLNQFLGKHNDPIRSVAKLFEPEFERLGIVVPERYWGRE